MFSKYSEIFLKYFRNISVFEPIETTPQNEILILGIDSLVCSRQLSVKQNSESQMFSTSPPTHHHKERTYKLSPQAIYNLKNKSKMFHKTNFQ